MRKIGLLTFLSILFLLPANLFAWGMTGHRIIAQIAEDNVRKSTSKKIKDLLDDMPMAYWANWPDYIKSDKTGKWDHTHVWHYVNAPGNMSKADFSDLLKGIEYDNIYKEILTLEKVLSDKESTKDEKRTALIFLIHLVGDAHQPMHMGRPEDLGGNKIPVSWFGRKTNLHSLWDGQLIEYEKYSYTEYADLLNVLPKNAKKDIQKGELLDWLYDVHTIANEIYDSVNVDDNLMYDYAYKYKTVVESQLQKGGLRLAVILDQVLK